ncbi:MAG: MotA/TolQ/ExbB proton channel family protein [Planctomycetes bacterium]|nr:MotA/TolQ/ExbB proton channel family protein [Planctomycetota bacterium]
MPLFLLAGPAAALQEGGGHGNTKTWLELFETTGPVGYLMLACSIAGTTLVIEHMVSLRRDKLAPAELAGEIEALINEEEYDQATELCDENPRYLTNVVGSALRMRDAGYQEMIAGLEAAANEETFKLNTKISYLSLIGNVAPLLGLLGTVTGMISSFQVIETLKAPTPGDLAKGVYESLVNTTMGLFIAILFLTIYFFFKNKVSKMCLSINLQCVDMLRHLAINEKAAA